MLSRLTAKLNEEEKSNFMSSYTSGYVFRNRLNEVLQEDIEKAQKKMLDEDFISSPSFENDALRLIAEIRSLTNLKKYLK